MCENDRYDMFVDVSPHALAEHRRENWPHTRGGLGPHADVFRIYDMSGILASPTVWGPGSLSLEASVFKHGKVMHKTHLRILSLLISLNSGSHLAN